MAIILGPPPPLETLLLSLAPPPFASSTDKASVRPAELARWHALLAQTLFHVDSILPLPEEGDAEDAVRLATALSRYDIRRAANMSPEDALDGWMVPVDSGQLVAKLLDRLPSPSIESLRPFFSAKQVRLISADSLRPLATPLSLDSTAESEPWRHSSAWGSWNILRRGIEALDPDTAPPLPLFLPPLLILIDESSPAHRLRGLWVLVALLRKCQAAISRGPPATTRGWSGPWLVQTGIGQLLMNSLNTILQTPSDELSHLILFEAFSCHTMLTCLLFAPNSKERFGAIEELIERGIVGTWVYRPGGEEGECARAVAEWLSPRGAYEEENKSPIHIWCGWIVVRNLGRLLPPLLHPLTTLSPTSSRSNGFIGHLLMTINALLEEALLIAPERVAAWRGRVLDASLRLWVGLVESELVDGAQAEGNMESTDSEGLQYLKSLILTLLSTLAKAAPSLKEELAEVRQLDERIFGELTM